MFFRKNKKRLHKCECGHDYFNLYYGVKSYREIPIYLFEEYELKEGICAWCRLLYYYLVRKVK